MRRCGLVLALLALSVAACTRDAKEPVGVVEATPAATLRRPTVVNVGGEKSPTPARSGGLVPISFSTAST